MQEVPCSIKTQGVWVSIRNKMQKAPCSISSSISSKPTAVSRPTRLRAWSTTQISKLEAFHQGLQPTTKQRATKEKAGLSSPKLVPLTFSTRPMTSMRALGSVCSMEEMGRNCRQKCRPLQFEYNIQSISPIIDMNTMVWILWILLVTTKTWHEHTSATNQSNHWWFVKAKKWARVSRRKQCEHRFVSCSNCVMKDWIIFNAAKVKRWWGWRTFCWPCWCADEPAWSYENYTSFKAVFEVLRWWISMEFMRTM
jgi:hypothetical protein